MLLILLTLCLRKPDGISHLFSIAYAFAGNGCYTTEEIPWGISHVDRRYHAVVIGKTGMGKTALLRNMILADIWRGAGVGVIDPHGGLGRGYY
jgi:hypothetical protein